MSEDWKGKAIVGIWIGSFLGAMVTKDSTIFLCALFGTLFVCGC